jgi:hypothetical protein
MGHENKGDWSKAPDKGIAGRITHVEKHSYFQCLTANLENSKKMSEL